MALQPFLEEMLHLQIFRQFIEERIETLNRGNSLSDEFEKEVVRYQEKVNSSNPGARILKSQYEQAKKEGGALVKAVKNKVRFCPFNNILFFHNFCWRFLATQLFFRCQPLKATDDF